MNDSNPWENQLRSWSPRRPSARLKAQIFSAAAATVAVQAPVEAATEAPRRASGGNWLYPAFACAALVMTVLSLDRPPAPVREGATNALLASVALSNHIISAVQTNTSGQDHNRWHVATFVSTKAGQTLSSMGSLPVLNTNNLMLKQ